MIYHVFKALYACSDGKRPPIPNQSGHGNMGACFGNRFERGEIRSRTANEVFKDLDDRLAGYQRYNPQQKKQADSKKEILADGRQARHPLYSPTWKIKWHKIFHASALIFWTNVLLNPTMPLCRHKKQILPRRQTFPALPEKFHIIHFLSWWKKMAG